MARDKERDYDNKGCSRIQAREKLAYKFIEKYKDKFPSLIKAFKEDLDALLNHLKLPFRHRRYVRTTNLVERSFEEEQRQTR